MADPVVQIPGDQDTSMVGADPVAPETPASKQNNEGNNGENQDEAAAAADGDAPEDPMEEEEVVIQLNPGEKFIR